MRNYRAQRARFVVDGVHPTAPHGTANGYDIYRCRCEPCRLVKLEYLAKQQARRLAERVEVDGRLVHPKAKHGTLYAYRAYGCRCEACRAVSRDHRAKQAVRDS